MWSLWKPSMNDRGEVAMRGSGIAWHDDDDDEYLDSLNINIVTKYKVFTSFKWLGILWIHVYLFRMIVKMLLDRLVKIFYRHECVG